MATRELWQTLIDEYAELSRRYAAVTDWYEISTPRPGATEAELVAAEQRLGRPLHPDHRLLLSVVNGWDQALLWFEILGTNDIAQGPKWDASLETLGIFADASGGGLAQFMGVEDKWDNCIPVLYDDNGYSGHVFMFTEDRRGAKAGSVFSVDDEAPASPDLYSRWVDELEDTQAFVAQEELGKWSKPWGGRNIREDPPSSADILALIADLSKKLAQDTPLLKPGVSSARLDALEDHIGERLTADHRALLTTSDGVIFPDYLNVLSVDEIADTAAWSGYLAEAAAAEQTRLDRHAAHMADHYTQYGTPPEAQLPPEPPAADRIGVIPAVPFGIWRLPHTGEVWVYGVDTRDGQVRNLISDALVSPSAYEGSHTSVTDLLLSYCERLYDLISIDR